MTDPAAAPDVPIAHKLTPEEYQRVKDSLGGEPTSNELCVLALWNVYCRTGLRLRRFPEDVSGHPASSPEGGSVTEPPSPGPAFSLTEVPDTEDPQKVLKTLLGSPATASKAYGSQRYDSLTGMSAPVYLGRDLLVCGVSADAQDLLGVDATTTKDPQPLDDLAQPSAGAGSGSQTNEPLLSPDKGSASIEVAPTDPTPQANAHAGADVPVRRAKHLAIATEHNAAWVHLSAREGSRLIVAQAVRQLACAGATPLGVAFNYGWDDSNPEERTWQLKGLAEACRMFKTAILDATPQWKAEESSGETSFGPSIAAIGLIKEPEHLTTPWFKDEGDVIILLGEVLDPADPLLGLGGSAYLQSVHGLTSGRPPHCDLEKEQDLALALRAFLCSGVVKSARNCGQGGLAVALAESCIPQGSAPEAPRLVGALVDLSVVATPAGTEAQPSSFAAALPRLDALLFGETPGRIVISVAAIDAAKVQAQARILGIRATRLGTVGGTTLQIKAATASLTLELADLQFLKQKPST